MAVTQAVERLVEAGGGEDFRAARQTLGGQVFEDEKVVFRAMAFNVFVERGAGIENLPQALAVIRQGRDAHQAVTGQLL